jgi:hypothetical protein
MTPPHPHRPPDYHRDHARPRTAPCPTNAVVEARLTDLISPATYALADEYRRLGLRWRILSLPVMVALLLALIWRQIPSVSTLVETLLRERLLWVPPRRVSQQAFSQRLQSLPASLMQQVVEQVLPTLQERSVARTRPLPPTVAHALTHFQRVWVFDATTLEELFHRTAALRGQPGSMPAGKLVGVLDVATKLPVTLWYTADAASNERVALPALQQQLPAQTLLLFDRGFYGFALFDWLTEHGCGFITRARTDSAYHVQQVLLETERVRDRIIQFGQFRSNPCRHPVRLIEVQIGSRWQSYLTNVLDQDVLSTAQVVDLYGRRWRIEEAFSLVKRLLGLSYVWTGTSNGIQLQLWATWLLYAVLVDLSDAVAQELDVCLDQVSVEMVYRGLYFFVGAYQRGETEDPVAYLAAQDDLGIVKRRRKYRERQRLHAYPPDLIL